MSLLLPPLALGAGELAVTDDLREHVRLSENQHFVGPELDLGPAVLAEDDLVAFLEIREVYTWEGERVFKVASFFLFRYASGRLGDVPAAHAHEVAEARWLPLDEAPRLLAYKGEREMAVKALDRLRS